MPRGRPRTFDPDYILDKAIPVFWCKGYARVSYDELTNATEINRPSLYAAFGEKEALFLRCIDRYLNTYGQIVLSQLERPLIHDAIKQFFRASVVNTKGGNTPPGCLVASVLCEASTDSEKLRIKLADCINRADELLQLRFEKAVCDGELPISTDCLKKAQITNSLRHGITLRARSGATFKELIDLAETASEIVLAV